MNTHNVLPDLVSEEVIDGVEEVSDIVSESLRNLDYMLAESSHTPTAPLTDEERTVTQMVEMATQSNINPQLKNAIHYGMFVGKVLVMVRRTTGLFESRSEKLIRELRISARQAQEKYVSEFSMKVADEVIRALGSDGLLTIKAHSVQDLPYQQRNAVENAVRVVTLPDVAQRSEVDVDQVNFVAP